MNRKQIENLYKVNGLTDYKLKSLDDLLKCHGIDYRIDGYSRLNDVDRTIYEKFILNIFNAFGLESRASLIPKGIYLAEQEGEGKRYLRFEYEHNGSNGWLHVINNGNEWY